MKLKQVGSIIAGSLIISSLLIAAKIHSDKQVVDLSKQEMTTFLDNVKREGDLGNQLLLIASLYSSGVLGDGTATKTNSIKVFKNVTNIMSDACTNQQSIYHRYIKGVDCDIVKRSNQINWQLLTLFIEENK